MAKPTWLLAGVAAVLCCGLPLVILFIASAAGSLADLIYPEAALLISSITVLVVSILIVVLLFRRYHPIQNRET